MRKESLRRSANRYLKSDTRGSFKDKQNRAFVIHKMIDDLFTTGETPSSWSVLRIQHIQNLIQLWQDNKIKPATIMDYMTTIRAFLYNIDCSLQGIDNKSLGLSRSYPLKRKKTVPPDIWTNINEPVAHIIMAFQIQFGLTFNEAINLRPDIHIKEHKLLLTREVAFNSEDRKIPIRHESQLVIIQALIQYSKGRQSLVDMHPYNTIRTLWDMALSAYKLPTNRTYRYLYAQQLKKELQPTLGNYQTNWLIRDEMGIKSPNTLWLYLNE